MRKRMAAWANQNLWVPRAVWIAIATPFVAIVSQDLPSYGMFAAFTCAAPVALRPAFLRWGMLPVRAYAVLWAASAAVAASVALFGA